MPKLRITARPRGRDELAEWYAAALDDQATSGLTVAEYAEEIGVAAATLYQWRRRLSVDAGGDLSAPPRPAGLVEVTLEAERTEPSIEAAGVFTVRLGCGRSIELPQHFDGSELRRLVEILESC